MNKRLISFLLLGSVLLSGCSNTNSNADLESRVSDLEQRVSALEIQANPTGDSYPISTTENAVASSNEPEAVSGGVYSISDMTANEIFDLVMYYYNNRPVQGESYDEFYKIFKVEPLSYNRENNIYASFNDDENRYFNLTQDEIIFIEYGATPSMKGDTMDVPDNDSHMAMAFGIQDYDKAEEVFSLFELYFSDNSHYVGVSSYRENGYRWEITHSTPNGDIYAVPLLSMEKVTGGYVFRLQL